jgi:hypothetical protein
VTGSTNASSLHGKKEINVRYQIRSLALPVAHTCFFQLDLPDYRFASICSYFGFHCYNLIMHFLVVLVLVLSGLLCIEFRSCFYCLIIIITVGIRKRFGLSLYTLSTMLLPLKLFEFNNMSYTVREHLEGGCW